MKKMGTFLNAVALLLIGVLASVQASAANVTSVSSGQEIVTQEITVEITEKDCLKK